MSVEQLAALFDCNAILLSGPSELNVLAACPATINPTPSDLAAAASVLATGEASGRGITPAAAIEWQFRPVASESLTIATVGLARDDGAAPVGEDRITLLQSLLDQIALALERARLDKEARSFAALRERDRVRSALLATIGQDLEPPLSAISRAVAELKRAATFDKSLVAAIGSEAARLQRYLSNLLELDPAADRGAIDARSVRIDLYHRAVTRNGEEVHLTPKEYAVLAELAKHPGRVLSHAHLLRAAWGPAQEAQTEYLRVAVRGLRQKLERNPAHPELILNEPAVGYRLAIASDTSP
jgi:K+-sensing histidine kinase KdpD